MHCFKRAIAIIIDNHHDAIVGARLILFRARRGPVRGFAVTLGLGVTHRGSSLAVMVTRLIVGWLAPQR